MKKNYLYHFASPVIFLILCTGNAFAQTYCSPTYATGTGSGDYISLVQITGTTLNNTSTGAASPYYTLFPATGSSTATLLRGGSYTLKVKGGTTANCYIAAWGDWNRNGVFEASEFIGASPNAGNSTTVTFTNQIKIPDTASLGTTIIRLRSGNISPGPLQSQSCGAANSTVGETEDYQVSLACQFSAPPSPSFTYSDSLFVKAHSVLVNVNQNISVTHKWYVNGSFVSSHVNLDYFFPTTGTYAICLKSTNCFGSDSSCSSVTVYDPTSPPIAGFSNSSDTVDAGATINFNDKSTKGPTYWHWSVLPASGAAFINGSSDSSENVSINFSSSGLFTVCIWDSNSAGRSIVVCKNILVMQRMCYYPFESNSLTGILFDDGGAAGNYGLNHTASAPCNFLINPCASSIKLVFTSFNMASGAFLRIFDGRDKYGIPLHTGTGFTGTALPGGVNGLSSASGKFYIEMQTATTLASGFSANWTAVSSSPPPPHGMLMMPDSTDDCGSLLNLSYISDDPDFTYEDAKFTWFGNINPTVGPSSINVAYGSVGVYPVQLEVSNCGGIETIIDTIICYHPVQGPVPGFFADNFNPTTADTVKLTDRSHTNAVWWQWTITGPGSYSIVSGNLSTPVVGLRFNTAGDYTIQLKDSNCVSSSRLVKTAYIHVIDYCVPVVSTINSDFAIQRFQVDRIDRKTKASSNLLDYTNTSPAVGTVTYRDNTSKYMTKFNKGNVYTSRIQAVAVLGDSLHFKVQRAGSSNAADIRIWIDYNQDGIFQAGELAAYNSNLGGNTFDANISIPVTVKTGFTRIRVGTNNSGFSNTPCGLNNYGEFNDYRLQVMPAVITSGDTQYVEIGRTFADPVTAIYGATSVVHYGLPYGTVIKTYPYFNRHKIVASDSAGNTTNTVINIKALPDTTRPVITLTGADTVYVQVDSSYSDKGAIAQDFYFGSFTSGILVTGSVNVNTPGTYYINFNVKDAAGNSAITKIRTVIVRDTKAPVITLTGGAMIIDVKSLTVVPEPGFTVTDNHYPSSALIVKVDYSVVRLDIIGNYLVRYYASDPAGNTDYSVTRSYQVVDRTPPSVTLTGDTVTIDVNTLSQVPEPGYSLSDNYYPVSSLIININYSQVKLDIIGQYALRYYISDSSGNTDSSSVRIYKVVDRIPPVITLKGMPVITWPRWKPYIDPGNTVTDNYYTGLVCIPDTSSLDVNIVGLFPVKFNITDPSGNKAQEVVRYISIYWDPGIDDLSVKRKIKIYPNPGTGKFMVDLENIPDDKLRVQVIDLQGKMIFSEAKVKNSAEMELDLESIDAGSYILQIYGDSGVGTTQFVIVK
jgi:PKD repeat protein